MATLSGFVPWIVYWVLVGDVPPAVAGVAALVVAVSSLVIARIDGTTPRVLEIGSTATFFVVSVLALAGEAFSAAWLRPLSFVGLFAVAVVAAVTDGPMVGEPAGPGAADETRRELVGQSTTRVTRVWVWATGAMAVSSVVPPITLGHPDVAGSGSVIAIVFGWVVPVALFSGAALASRVLDDRVAARLASPETVRRTTFVAFRELAIDELYYLAREKAEREVGAGMEAYDVTLGSSGLSLTGDDSRESWPATYKVRARR